MNKIICAFIIVGWLYAIPALSQNAIEVSITNIKEPKGKILIAIFNNEKDFLTRAFSSKTVTIDGSAVKVVFDNLSPGDYAISVFHDQNLNGALDKNFVGMPIEGFGFGNNSMGMFGPPSFEKAKVNLKGKPVVQEISLKYL